MLSLIIFTFALAAPAIFAASGNEEVYRMPEEEVLKLGELLEDSFDSSQNTNFDNTNNPSRPTCGLVSAAKTFCSPSNSARSTARPTVTCSSARVASRELPRAAA
ncbi:hypothetical protein L596_014356 [Steinernema carpocapsae]|uniref:Uncharacterized protein n=1 Tax=Steinernema carpocapsae TaxID=34508 RepID=A0A4U5NC94_STECR|nr:hypothetical protein L596_014356 [Steinernema carpocapsae]